MPQFREKFATQVDSKVLAEIRRIARAEGRQLQVIVEEAFIDLIEKRTQSQPRPNIMAAYQGSHGKFSALYRKLAE